MLATASLHIAILFAAAMLLLAAAYNDAHKYKIPNLVCAALLVLFPLAVLTAPRTVEWDQN
ncbi:hypothetical protein ACSTK3_23440, partial [Vibrio parahaemolyticus]